MADESNNMEIATTTPDYLLKLAVAKDADLDKIEKLMDLKERWDKTEAKKAFLKAMADFQAECPELKKGKTVDFANKSGGRTKYKYITLSDIVRQIRSILKDCNLSFRWETKDVENEIELTCIVSHISGHSESNTMKAAKDISGKKNAIQSVGSTMTYLQRYTLIGALGISTADEDTDGNQAPPEIATISEEDQKELVKEGKLCIDVFDNANELQEKSRPYLDELSLRGLNKSNRKSLAAYITNHYNKLKSDETN